MQLIQPIFILYGGILLLGAYMGWKAGSRVSLIMGVSSGLLVFCAIYLSTVNAAIGYSSLVIISGLLSVVFIIRFIKTHKMMPSGMLMGLNIAAFALSLYQLLAI